MGGMFGLEPLDSDRSLAEKMVQNLGIEKGTTFVDTEALKAFVDATPGGVEWRMTIKGRGDVFVRAVNEVLAAS